MSEIFSFLYIFGAKVIEMSMDTFRINFIVKGKRALGSLLGFIEVMVWITVARQVISGDVNLFTAIAYAGGYAAGCYLGSFIEEKLAIGTISVEVITSDTKGKLPNILREKGFGVSVVECRGKNNVRREMLKITANRKDLVTLQDLVTEFDDGAFVTVFDTQKVVNGFFVRR